MNIIHSKINTQTNYKLNNLIDEFKYNLINLSIDEISTVLIEELDLKNILQKWKKIFKKLNIKMKLI